MADSQDTAAEQTPKRARLNQHGTAEGDDAIKDEQHLIEGSVSSPPLQPIKHINWTNLREHPHWFNYPLDCFLIQEQFEENRDESKGSESTKLVMFCASGSDLWRKTSYGFVKDTGHAFLGTLVEQNRGVEVGFSVDSFKGQFDQGGILVRENENNWLKAGVELSDGVLQLSVVATRSGFSDWSTVQWPSEWEGETDLVIGVDRVGDALIARIRLAKDRLGWRMLRLCPMNEDAEIRAGPYSCAPTRNGLYVEFSRYVERPAMALHEQ